MAYKLDYTIDRDIDRLEAVRNILDKKDQVFRNKDLELMANYLLYGKDENGKNALQRGEIDKTVTKHNTYKKKSDKEESLDALLEMASNGSPMPKMTKIGEKYIYKKARPCITPEDSSIPGMKELQDAIKRIDLSIRYAEGKLDPSKLPADYSKIETAEQLYKMKHVLIDMRRHQYYLKDAYKPTIRLLGVISSGKQNINWGGKIHCGGNRYAEFDWENYNHIAALLRNYSAIKMDAVDDPTGWQTALIMDFDRYYNMADIPKIYDFLVTLRIDGLSFKEIAEKMEQKFGKAYGIAYLSCLLSEHIPRKISLAAKRHRLLTEDSVRVQQCPLCGQWLPGDPVFFKQSGLCTGCNRRKKLWREKEHA